MTSCLQCGHDDPGGFTFCPRCGTRAVESVGKRDPLLGLILNGKYRVESEIGVGAMGRVYLGEHIGLKKRVALKVLHSDLQVSDESLQRFQREGIAAGKFDHPHAIQIFDFDKSDGRVFYLAMEFVDGVNLGVFLRQRGRLPTDVALLLAHQMVSCLAEAHKHGIVHRDFKPENIMVSEGSRGDLRVKVLDFGLSKLVDRRLNSSLVTQPGRLLGTPLYMAPEQVAGDEADARSDVYAAGLILYEMLAGERPFREANATQLFLTRPTVEAPSIRADHPELDVPEEVDDILQRALARDRADRFQSGEELFAALDALVSGGTSSSMSRSRAPGLPRPMRPAASTRPAPTAAAPARRGFRGALWVAMGVLLLAGAGLTAFLFLGSDASARPARVRLIPDRQRTDLERRYLGLLDDARAALLSGNTDQAVTAVEQSLLFECRDAEALLVRAEAHRARGDLDTARLTLQAAADADPSFLDARIGQAWLAYESGRLSEAEGAFEAAASIDANSAEVSAGRGALAWKRGRTEEATTLVREALARSPTCAAAHRYVGRLALDAGDANAALASLLEAKRYDPRSLDTLTWLSDAYLALGREDEADLQLAEALRIDPGATEVRVQRASLMLDRGHTEEALTFLEESLRRRADPRLWVLRGIALHAANQTDEAISALQRGVELGAEDAEARCLLGVLLHAKGDLVGARAQYQAVLKEHGEVPAANLNLGLIQFAGGEYEAAAQRFQRVLDFDESIEFAHLQLGLLYKDYLGDRAKAREHLERYVALGGEDERVPRWLNDLR